MLISYSSGAANELVPVSAYSPDIHLSHSKATVADEHSVYSLGSSLRQVNFGSLPSSADVDAVHGMDNGDVLFSLESSIVLGGTLYRPSDIIRFDGSVWTKEFDGVEEGIPYGANIDAIAVSGDALYFSLDIDAAIGSVIVNDADVIAFSGVDFIVFLSASEAGINQAADVDALHLDNAGRVLISLDGTGNLGGIHYRDEDLLSWDSPDWSIEFDGSADDAAWQQADLDAWSIVFFDDNIFSDGFEMD